MPGKAYATLFELAADQYGYVTAAMAHEAGFAKNTLNEMARRGQLRRAGHGLYRFEALPATGLDSYMEATLWPQGLRGVLSHETALDLYDVCDVNPAKIHLTVPATHRILRAVPKVYVVHHEDLAPAGIRLFEGIPMTTPAKTIHDCIKAHSRPDLLRQALEHGRARGLLRRDEHDQLLAELERPWREATSTPRA